MGVTEVLSMRLYALGLILKMRYVCNNAQEFTDVYMYIDNTVCSTLVLDNAKNMQLYQFFLHFTVCFCFIPILCYITMN